MGVVFRITYERYSELSDDAHQMVWGGLLVKITEAADLGLDTPASLELVLPDGSSVDANVKVLQVLGAHGVAVTIDRAFADDLQKRAAAGSDRAGARAARHERLDRPTTPPAFRTAPGTTPPSGARTAPGTSPPGAARTSTDTPTSGITARPPTTPPTGVAAHVVPRASLGTTPPAHGHPRPPTTPPPTHAHPRPPTTPPPAAVAAAEPEPAAPPESQAVPSTDKLTQAEKIHMALHGNREQRNAILRDPNRALHPYVLKNPQLGVDDVLAMAKNAQSAPEMLKLISGRKEWLQNPQIAQALARNPKTPQDAAIRALDFIPLDALRQLAKGGALPAVVAAARKKVIK